MSFKLTSQSAGAFAPTTPSPQLFHHVGSTSNLLGLGLSGDNFKIPLPNPCGGGNCIVLGITYPHGQTPTITDNNGNSWPGSPAVSADNGAGNYISAIYVLPNINSGQTTINVSFGASVNPFQYSVSEFNGIATVSPISGTSGGAGHTGASLSTGSFTPGNNDANGGNLIWNYYCLGAAASAHPTDWAPGGSFSLLEADICDGDNNGFPHACQWRVQQASSAINPSVTATGDTANHYNCLAVALKCAPAGTPVPSGIRVIKLLHQSTRSNPVNMKLKTPWLGNARFICTPDLAGYDNLPTDTGGSTYAQKNASPGPYMWLAQNTAPDNAAITTINPSAGGTGVASFRIFDIQGAAASCFDVVANQTSTSVASVTSISNFPNITPTTANGLVIATGGLNTGPGLSAPSPTGAIWDMCTYDNEVDGDLMENADYCAHFYNPGTGVIHWGWTFTSQTGNFTFAAAVALKAA